MKLRDLIADVYNAFLPIAESLDVELGVDFADATTEIEGPEELKQELSHELNELMKQSQSKKMRLRVKDGKVSIVDPETVLSPRLQEILSTHHVKVKSRVGFGTTATFEFGPEDDESANDGELADDEIADGEEDS